MSHKVLNMTIDRFGRDTAVFCYLCAATTSFRRQASLTTSAINSKKKAP